jgi:hypothetical protein
MSDSQSGNFVPPAAFSTAAGPMGPAGVEPATSSLSGTRSNQLSYEPFLREARNRQVFRPVAWSALPPCGGRFELRTSAHVSRPLVATTTSESHILSLGQPLSTIKMEKLGREFQRVRWRAGSDERRRDHAKGGPTQLRIDQRSKPPAGPAR